MGVIRIQNLKIKSSIGVTVEERSFPSLLLFNIDLRLSLLRAGQSDSIADTINYESVINVVKETCCAESSALLEHLSLKCANTLLLTFPLLDSVTIEIYKHIFTETGAVGIIESYTRDVL